MENKKVRGLRRHARNHQRWAAVPHALSLSLLESYHLNTEQLGLAPWTVHGKPSLAIRQLWAGRLLADFLDWQRQLAVSHPTAWLAIRLYDPRFGLSQLDAAIQEKQAYFERRYGHEGEDVPLPPEYQALPGAAQLPWACYAVVDMLDPEDFAEHYAWYKRKPYWHDQTSAGEACVVVQTGWVWVGRAAT